MKNEKEYKKKRETIVSYAYDLFVNKGLEKTSIRDIANISGVNVNTIYYYFRTKAEIVICCVEYGLERISKNLFEVPISQSIDGENLGRTILEYSLVNKDQFCWCYQVITSPNYNWLMKDILSKTRQNYDEYIVEIAQKYQLKLEPFKTLVELAILVIKDYMITEDSNCFNQIDFICSELEKIRVNEEL